MTNRALVPEYDAEGNYPRVLCICAAGILRSPTIAWVLSNTPFNFNTRSAGIEDSYALIKVDYALLQWADYAIICAEDWQMWKIQTSLKYAGLERDVYSLNTPDDYNYRDPVLIKLITDKCMELFINTTVV